MILVSHMEIFLGTNPNTIMLGAVKGDLTKLGFVLIVTAIVIENQFLFRHG